MALALALASPVRMGMGWIRDGYSVIIGLGWDRLTEVGGTFEPGSLDSCCKGRLVSSRPLSSAVLVRGVAGICCSVYQYVNMSSRGLLLAACLVGSPELLGR
jgi:hypothetical protein